MSQDEQLRPLLIRTRDGEHELKVELALTPEQHSRGLMFRRSMAADHGMLFIYEREHEVGMWMKNTPLSLDMLFVRRDGRIVTIARTTEPFSKRVIPSNGPVIGVLEVNAGTVERLGIDIGDQLIHPLLKQP